MAMTKIEQLLMEQTTGIELLEAILTKTEPMEIRRGIEVQADTLLMVDMTGIKPMGIKT